MRKVGKKQSKILAVFVTGYIALSFPVVTVFSYNEYFRFVYFEILNGWKTKFTPPRYVFCGDSITAGGRNWGFRLEGNLLNSMNLAGNGYTASQIFNQVSIALNYKPDYVFIMAGTNDVLQKDFSPSNTIKEYENIIQAFKGTKTIPVFTLIPLTSSKDVNINKHIKILNSQLDSLLKSQGITTIDLNPYLAPSGYLSKEYTTDGVHLSEAGYKIWVREVKKNNFISTQ